MREITPPATSQHQTMWRKSSFCQQGECVEVAVENGTIALRSSRSPSEVVHVTAAEWRAFSAGITAGEFTDVG